MITTSIEKLSETTKRMRERPGKRFDMDANVERTIAITIMIRAYMREQGISIKEVASMLNVSTATVNRWRAPRISQPDLQQQGSLCKLFGCSLHELHGDFSSSITNDERKYA